EISELQSVERNGFRIEQGHSDDRMIAEVGTGNDRQSEREVVDPPRNQADMKHRISRAHRQRKLPGARHAARSRLDGREPAKMRRDSNAAAGIGAKAE